MSLFASVFLTSCAVHRHTLPSVQPEYAVSTAMRRQIANAIDAGDGDYQGRGLREQVLANPNDWSARLKLAGHYEQAGFPELALEHYRFAASRFPDNPEVSIRLAKSLRDLGYAQDAIQALLDFSNRNPRPQPELLSLLGILQDDAGQVHAGEQAYRRALATSPDVAYLRNNLGYNLLLQGKSAEAADEFRKALAIEPHSQFANNNLGLALAAQSSRGEAGKQALLRWESIGGPATAHSNLASVLIEKGQYADARKELEIALGYQRDHAAALANLKLVSELDGKAATLPAPTAKSPRPAGLWGYFRLSFEKVFTGNVKEGAPAADRTASTEP